MHTTYYIGDEINPVTIEEAKNNIKDVSRVRFKIFNDNRQLFGLGSMFVEEGNENITLRSHYLHIPGWHEASAKDFDQCIDRLNKWTSNIWKP